MRAVVLLLLLLSAAHPAAASVCDRDWQILDRVDPPERGYIVSKCRPSASEYDAYRLEAVVDAPPALVAGAARAEMADPNSKPDRAEKTVIRADADEVVVYMYANLPLVSDRDAITHARLISDEKAGSYRLAWQATDREGPAPKEGVVRIAESTGGWTFLPLEGGNTRAIYESHSDLAGSIPAWLVNSLMTEAVIDNIARLRARVERERAK